MTVYADILIITNFITDYFLLVITGKIIKKNPGILRSIIAALTAAAGSLTIFLPEQNAFLKLIFRLVFSLVICLVCFGFHSIRRLLLATFVFWGVTTCFAGSMIAIWYIFKPFGMVINNSVVYFNISPAFLICFSVLGYLIFSLLSSLLSSRGKTAVKCKLNLTFCNKEVSFDAIIDSGNSLTDAFGNHPVIIADRKKVADSFGNIYPQSHSDKYRAVPCGTVAGSVILDGFRCEHGRIIKGGEVFNLDKPIMAISKAPLCDCEAIVNPLDCN